MHFRLLTLLRCSITFGVLLLPVCAASAQGDETDPDATSVESRIDRVLLYSDRAMVIRKARAHVPAGRSRVAFEGLPEKLRDGSVAASLVGGVGTAAGIANIEVEPVHESTFRSEEAKKANEELKKLHREMRVLQDRLANVKRTADFARQIRIGTRPKGAPNEVRFLPLSPHAWAGMLDFLADEFLSAAKRERELIEEMDDLRAQTAVAAAKARMLLSYKTRLTKRVIIEIAADRPAECDLELSYIVSDAGWFPRYDVRADLKQGRVEIIAYALARQESGEDWRDVGVAFSAAEPSVAADIPKLRSWRIAAEPPIPRPQADVNRIRGARRLAKRRRGLALGRVDEEAAQLRDSLQQTDKDQRAYGYPAAAPERRAGKAGARRGLVLSNAERVERRLGEIERLYREQEDARKRRDWSSFSAGNTILQQKLEALNEPQQQAFGLLIAENARNLDVARRQLRSQKLRRGLVPPVRSSRGYDYRWRALRRESVPSDGALSKVVLFRRVFPAEFVYEIAAAKSKMAYLRTKLKNTTKSPFLAGPVSVFLGSDFVGESQLKTCAPSEEFALGLGADEAILVERKSETKRETRGVFSNVYRFSVATGVTVRNRKGRRVSIAVYEQLPYTWDDKLEISEGTFSPAPTRTLDVAERPALLCWEMDLAPGEKKTVGMEYWFQHGADLVAVTKEDPSRTW